MKESYGTSSSGNLKEAVRGFTNPAFLILMSNAEQFESHVAELEELYPDVPSIGCIGMSYQTSVTEKGVSVTAFEGVEVVTDVIEQASIMPVKYIGRVEKALQKINASSENTVCIDFCTGNDAAVLTTMYSILEKKKISLTGGTGDGGKVSVNGTVYTDADAFAFVKNTGGKVKVYKENIYYPLPQYRFIASNTDRSKYTVGELNGKPAKQVYEDTLGIREQDIVNQTFKNPIGKKNGQDICIISIKEVAGNALGCYRQVNDSDVLYLLETNDYPSIVEETVRQIKGDFARISGVFSVNCIFRYLFFSQEHYMDQYLKTMGTLGMHAGLVGFGEHYNSQFVNQTMSCVVFE